VPTNGPMAGMANAQARMPAILRRRDYQTWLRGTPVEAKNSLQSYNPAWMEAYAVSPRINSEQADDAQLIRPVDRPVH
jgi:putative SOS response-associated peptidase YedK